MIGGIVGRFGLGLAVLGALAVAASAWWPAPADELATAAAGGASEAAAREGGEDWRGAVLLAGGICLAAGVGLVLLAVLPGRRA